MKKIFYFLFAAFMMIGIAANAQTVKNDGVFSHMYIGINGGVNQSTVSDYSNWTNDEGKFDFVIGAKSLTYNAGIELGKDVTPITGFSLQASVAPIYTFNENAWCVNRTDLFGNVKFNLMNLFGGYKGYPRRVEIKTVTGIGWNHYFDTSDEPVEQEKVAENPNNIALQAGLEFDFNLGKNRNWYITFTPIVQANEILRSVDIKPMAENAELKANVGVAYRFGRGNKSHNFEICDKVYTQDQYDELYAMYDDCMSTANRVDTVIVEKVVEVEKPVVDNRAQLNVFVDFEKGSSKLSTSAKRAIKSFVEGIEYVENPSVKVVGSADSGTGTPVFNEKLAWERANVVASELVNQGIKEVSTEILIDIDEDAESSRCALITVE